MGFGGWIGKQARRLTAPRSEPQNLVSISDPALASLFQIGAPNFSGVDINESSAMSLSAVYRAVSLVAGTIGTLVMRQLRQDPNTGMIVRLSGGWTANPGGVYGPTPMSWQETVAAHMMLHGQAFLRKIIGGAGQLLQLDIIHPLCVSIELPMPDDRVQPVGGKWFRVSLIDGTQLRLDALEIIHIPGLSLDGIQGVSVITAARNGLGTAVAGDRAAARMFNSGALISGLAYVEDADEDETKVVKASLDRSVNGWENAGDGASHQQEGRLPAVVDDRGGRAVP